MDVWQGAQVHTCLREHMKQGDAEGLSIIPGQALVYLFARRASDWWICFRGVLTEFREILAGDEELESWLLSVTNQPQEALQTLVALDSRGLLP